MKTQARINEKPNDEKQANRSAKMPGAGVPKFTKGTINPKKSNTENKSILFFNLKIKQPAIIKKITPIKK